LDEAPSVAPEGLLQELRAIAPVEERVILDGREAAVPAHDEVGAHAPDPAPEREAVIAAPGDIARPAHEVVALAEKRDDGAEAVDGREVLADARFLVVGEDDEAGGHPGSFSA